MYKFFAKTDAEQHDHHKDHGHAGFEVDYNDNNSKSESTHDNEKLNHNKEEKESTDMNRKINKTIAPILAGFAISLLFIFSQSSNANGFTKANVRNDNLDYTVAKNDGANINKTDVTDKNLTLNVFDRFSNDNATARFNDGDLVNNDDQNFAGTNAKNTIKVDDANFARLGVDRIKADDNFAFTNKKDVKIFDNGEFIGFDKAKLYELNAVNVDARNPNLLARVDSDAINGFKDYDLNQNNFAS